MQTGSEDAVQKWEGNESAVQTVSSLLKNELTALIVIEFYDTEYTIVFLNVQSYL